MKLLICTQAVDKNHPILGFFHSWIEEFAKHFAEVHVICLQKGEYALPKNVSVYSLGKENGEVRSVVYGWRLLKLAWKKRQSYDVVFVHMNPEYVLAGAPAWLLLRKPVSLWYTHGTVSIALRLANRMVKNIFTAAKEGMNLSSQKVIVTGHGIGALENSQAVDKDIDLLTVGRITPSKNLESLVEVLREVRLHRASATLTIVGTTAGVADETYLAKLKEKINSMNLKNAVTFIGARPHTELPGWFKRARVFVHAATNGSLDKVLLEALASKTPVVSSAVGARSLPLGAWQVDSVGDFSQEVLRILAGTPSEDIDRVCTYVIQKHSLKSLVETLSIQLKSYGV